MPQDSTKCSRPRVVLSNQQAREIFELQKNHGFVSLHAASLVFSKKYHVSPKAIRDIWKGRSWLEATYNLWNATDRPERRIIGRPKGKKDSKPRKVKSNAQDQQKDVSHSNHKSSCAISAIPTPPLTGKEFFSAFSRVNSKEKTPEQQIPLQAAQSEIKDDFGRYHSRVASSIAMFWPNAIARPSHFWNSPNFSLQYPDQNISSYFTSFGTPFSLVHPHQPAELQTPPLWLQRPNLLPPPISWGIPAGNPFDLMIAASAALG